jgi:alanine-glyoxylate transaminase/serine-glyoxylate transaminase/serine-pyruvate transaminase
VFSEVRSSVPESSDFRTNLGRPRLWTDSGLEDGPWTLNTGLWTDSAPLVCDSIPPVIHRGRHFLQIPGPTNTPDRILRAMAAPTIDHRGPEFAELGREVLAGLKTVFQTESPVVVYPASGSGAWEASLVNTLSPGDKVLAFDIGEFSKNWAEVARRLGLEVEVVPGTWRRGVDSDDLGQRLADDRDHRIKAVLVVHNETATGVTTRLQEVRRAIDGAGHPALLLVDAVSSLGSIDLRHDEWGLDVTLSGSQKGLMLPPGLSFNAISQKALAASKSATLPRSYWAWDAMLAANANGYFPTTPATNMLFGLREALRMLDEEGLPAVFARHRRLAGTTRAAVRAWTLEILCEREDEFSPVVTTVMMPTGHDADRFRQIVLDRFNMSLGSGLGRLKGKAFRIGHLGDFNELMLIGTLGGVELGLAAAGVPFTPGGVTAALASLSATNEPAAAGVTGR